MEMYEAPYRTIERKESRILLTKHRLTREHVAIKQFKKDRITAHNVQEIFILRELGPNEYIIRLVDYFQTDDTCNIVMEYANQSTLYEYCKRKVVTDQVFQRSAQAQLKYYRDILIIFGEIALGVRYLHKNGIIHRDIKPENIMFKNNTVKIIDFGYSTEKQQPRTQCGTPQFSAPEICENKEYTLKCDVYSLGCTLYFIALWRYPYAGQATYAAIQRRI